MGNQISLKICLSGTIDDLSEEELLEAVLKFIELSDDFRDVVFGDDKPTKRSRTIKPRCSNLWSTTWGLLIKQPDVKNPSFYYDRKFRRRVKVPFQLFDQVLVPICQSKNIFGMKYRSRIPIEFKILIALRILGRDDVCDTTAELASIGESTCNYIFKQFVVNFSNLFYDKYVYFPDNNELKNMMNVYSLLGFPGACGSMDCTHIRWSACPSTLTNLCPGKVGFPSLAYLCIVDHNRRILRMSNSIYGTDNDIGISHNDEFCQSSINGKFKNISFNLYNKKGQPIKHHGGYLLVDGGFLKLPWLINPDKNNFEDSALYWSEWLESIRKDVECTFGILKSRFRFFKNGTRFTDQYIVDSAMKCVCILHNMLLKYDRLDLFEWENIDWVLLDPEEDDEEEEIEDAQQQIINNLISPTRDFDDFISYITNISDPSYPIIKYDTTLQGIIFRPNNSSDYLLLKELLIQHFVWQYSIGELKWPKHLKSKSKSNFSLCPATNRLHNTNEPQFILNNSNFKGLYMKPSDIKVKHIVTKTYTVSIDNGLFSSNKISPNTKLAEFIGDIISKEQYESNIRNKCGGYGVYINATTI